MLSYQHAYHAGNLADVQKHALLAWALDYLTGKDKPLSYIETHAGRGLYDLDGDAARRTGEARAGIGRLADSFAPDHPYRRALDKVRADRGPAAYPGSPLIARTLLRRGDRMHLAELHPAEHAGLRQVLGGEARLYEQDGMALAASLCPPDPRRGLLLCDPSWEVKRDYTTIPAALLKLHRAWNVGILALWYPILGDARHAPMLDRLCDACPGALRHEVRFPPAREGHGMVGSGLFVINPPWGMADEADRLTALFAKL
jgi:23S rRNA (adenine2030-N6)-methyltransferase